MVEPTRPAGDEPLSLARHRQDEHDDDGVKATSLLLSYPEVTDHILTVGGRISRGHG